MIVGIDAPFDVTPILPALVASGVGIVGRYVTPPSATFPTKGLTRAEAEAIHAANLRILSLYEHGAPTGPSYFVPDRGRFDADEAVACAEAAGQGAGTIYFAVDYDADASDVAGPIARYLDEVRVTLGDEYRLGLYGSGRVLGLAQPGEFRWLAQSTGWAGYSPMLGDVVQGPTIEVGGRQVDSDQAMVACGAW